MSLILDALNRADRERNVEDKAPNLQSAHNYPVAGNHAVRRWLIDIVIIACVVLIGIYLYSRDSGTAPAVSSTNTIDTVIEPESGPVNPPSAATVSTAQEKPLVTATPVISNAPIKPQQPPAPPADIEAINSLYQQSTTVTSAPTNHTDQAATSAKVVNRKTDNTQSILLSIPLLTEQSQHLQRAIPSIEYSVHAYAEQGGFVILNGRQYRVGGLLTPDLRVIAILENSLVLDYNGRQFRLLALNSWINL